MISVDNVTMQQAVSTWWEGSRTAKSAMIADCYWKTDPPFICNPVCATLPGPYSLSANASRKTHIAIKTDDSDFPTFAQWLVRIHSYSTVYHVDSDLRMFVFYNTLHTHLTHTLLII